MKRLVYLTMIIVAIVTVSFNQKVSAQNPVEITYQDFYDSLSPYGTWIDYAGYGHVWRPNVEDGFRPYLTNGYWVYTDAGWFWNSDYDWGWAPFHYGSWIYDDFYGWLWVPGYSWAPAWVTWGSFNGYYGWAPLMPGINIGKAFTSWRPHAFYWNIVPCNRMCDRDLTAIRIVDKSLKKIGKHMVIVDNFTNSNQREFYSAGPRMEEVNSYTNNNISITRITDNNRIEKNRVEGGNIRVYRPDVRVEQPEQARKAEKINIRPIVDDNQWPKHKFNVRQQRENIERLPIRRSMKMHHSRR
jgi:hypothetical protein